MSEGGTARDRISRKTYPRFPRPCHTGSIPSTEGPLTGGDHQMGTGMQVARRLNVRLR